MGSGTLTAVNGMITNIADHLRPPTTARLISNYNMIKQGILTNQYCGWSRVRSTALNGSNPVFDFAKFHDTAGTRYLLVQAYDKLMHYDFSTHTTTNILTGLTTALASGKKALPCMRMFAPYVASVPYMVHVNGIDAPKKITYSAGFASANLQLNGANFGTVALSAPLPAKTPAKPKFCEPFLDRMIFAGFEGDAAFDVLIPNAGDASICTQSTPLVATDGGLIQVDPTLGAITAVKAFKLSPTTTDQVVLVGQEEGVSLITGKSALDFQCFTLTDEYGIPSNRGFVQIGSNIWFISSDGFRQFATLVENANLINSSLLFPCQDIASRINVDQFYQAHLVHHKKYQEVQMWFPLDADTDCKNAFIFSYNNGSDPQQLSPSIFFKEGTSAACSIYFNRKMYAGGYDGLLQEHHTGNKFDTAVATSVIQLAHIFADTPQAISQLTCQVRTEGGAQKFKISTAYSARVLNSSGQYSMERKEATPGDYELISDGGDGTVLGSWPLGVSAFATDGIRVHDFQPVGFGSPWEVELKCNQEDHRLEFAQFEYQTT